MDKNRQFPCESCGADLKFDPGVETLKCPYCGHENHIHIEEDFAIEELDYEAHLHQARNEKDLQEVITVKCPSCAAETTLTPNVTSDECPFCGTSLVKTTESHKIIKPEAVLPFRITQAESQKLFREWLGKLWFAPNKLQEFARNDEGLNGMYLPHWTYDSNTTTRYTGQRGEHYWVTESYTAVENGKTVRRTRQVQKTRWYPARGTVYNTFDDVLVVATDSLPRNYVQALQPWDLQSLVPYNDSYLSGFRTESYHVDLEQGFHMAQGMMQPTIDATIRRDIGGDTQMIHSKDTHYQDITFKHVLLPIWISAYRYQNKVYRFLVNGRTGQVQGERPWSWVKITLAIISVVIIILAIIYLTQDK